MQHYHHLLTDSPLNDTADGDDSDNAEEDNDKNVKVRLIVVLH